MTSTNPNHRDPKGNLVQNEQGAVMIMGLAMILGLIAFMWFLLGIGETLAFRDHMQDAADSAAFTQSAVSALGMNLIVLINMILLLMVAIYVGYSVVITAEWVGSVVCCPTPAFLECCPKIPGYISDWNSRNNFAKDEAEIEGVLSKAQSVIALLVPLAGTGFSYYVQSDYKMKSMTSGPYGAALSPMNFPGTFSLSATGKRYGLPVAHEHLDQDCAHIFDVIAGLANGFLPKAAQKVVGAIGGVIGEIVQWYYCGNTVIPGISGPTIPAGNKSTTTTSTDANGNSTSTTNNYPPSGFPPTDGSAGGSTGSITNGIGAGAPGWLRLAIGGGDAGNYWTADGYGPMTNYNHQNPTSLTDIMPLKDRHKAEYKNDADYMQSYAIVLVPSAYNDHHASHNIGLMQLQHLQGFNTAEVKPTVLGYYAESELYFDCKDKWASDDCDNNNGIDRMDMTVYRFEWRARLVKFHLSGGIGKVFDFVSKGLGDVSAVKAAINGSGANEFVQALQYFDQLTGLNVLGMIGSIADMFPGTPAH